MLCAVRTPGVNLSTHSVDLVERLPVLLGRVDALRRLDGSLQQTRPHAQVRDALVVHELSERVGVLDAARRQVAVAPDATLQVHVRLPVLQTENTSLAPTTTSLLGTLLEPQQHVLK